MVIKLACAAFAVIISVALFQYHQARLHEQKRRVSIRIAKAIEVGEAGNHYQACQIYNEMLNEGLLIDDWSNEILKRECFKAQ